MAYKESIRRVNKRSSELGIRVKAKAGLIVNALC